MYPLCRILIASIMEEYTKASWEELIEGCEAVGVDAFEINFRYRIWSPTSWLWARMETASSCRAFRHLPSVQLPHEPSKRRMGHG